MLRAWLQSTKLLSVCRQRSFHKIPLEKVRRLKQVQAVVQHKRARAALRSAMDKPIVQGVVFDMDGTLTVPCIDFAEMRRRVGIPQGDILDAISKMKPSDAAAANQVLADIESEALANMRLMPGAAEVAQLLDTSRIPRGLITRNVLASVDHFHANALTAPPFNPALARCFTPYKPAPDALLHICETWGIQPSTAVMVGDSAKDDIVCGNRAGAITILIDVERRYRNEELPSEQRPTFHVHSMADVQRVLQQEVTLQAPEQLVDKAAA